MMTDYTTVHADRSFWAAPFAALRDSWVRYRIYARTQAELSGLSTRELDDLGISRGMISRLAHEAAYGKSA